METDVRNKNHVRIFDTTLRDGEQSPGASLTSAEKLEIARHLAALGVDIIEAGFPAASPDDLAAVRRVAEEVGKADGPVICGLARAVITDIDKAWEAIQYAAKPRIHTFMSTSDIHLKYQFNIDQAEALDRIQKTVKYARSFCADVEFSPMDAGRTKPEFVAQACALAIAEGATTLNIPDTVGFMTPDEYGSLIKYLIENTPGGKGEDIIWSVHCHDDLGMATANTLAGLCAGARQAEVTINGLGERAGNTPLEEVVMAINTRDTFYSMSTGIHTQQLSRISRLVANYTGIVVPPNKAIIGANAFAHEAGIHQDGQLKNQSTYEIMRPESIGLSESRLVLGKHSGRHAFKVRLASLGFKLDDEKLQEAFKRFKDVADRKKHITDADLEALLADQLEGPVELYKLQGIPAYSAIDKIVKAQNTLLEFAVHAITEGVDALGEVTVRICTKDGDYQTFGGHGADPDIIVASAKAYLAALNRMLVATGSSDVSPEGESASVRLPSAD